MPVSLKAFAESLSTGTVVIRGQSIPIRALRDSERERLLRLFPEPSAPLGPDPTRGTLAPPAPNESDPAYLKARDEWHSRFLRVQLAASCGFGEPGEEYDEALSDSDLQARLAALVAMIGRSFTGVEIGRLWSGYFRLLDSDAQQRARDALIVELTDKTPADQMPSAAAPLPENYATTAAYADFEVMHYFPCYSVEALHRMDPGLKAILRAHVRVRKEEQAKQG